MGKPHVKGGVWECRGGGNIAKPLRYGVTKKAAAETVMLPVVVVGSAPEIMQDELCASRSNAPRVPWSLL